MLGAIDNRQQQVVLFNLARVQSGDHVIRTNPTTIYFRKLREARLLKNSSNMVVLGLVCLSFVAGPHLVRAHFRATSGNEDSLQKTIVEQERRELDCLKTGNMELFSTLIADDAVFVNARGTAGKAEVVKNTSDVRLEEFTMEDVRFARVSAESGVIAYKLTEKGTAHGKAFSAQVYASALWVKRDGKWVSLFSQETAAR